MATRLIGTDSANPRLPAGVIAATQGTTAADLAPGDVLDDANAYTDAQVANKLTQAAADTRYINAAGDTMTGPLIVVTPTDTNHAATKAYVDASGGGAGGGITEAEADARYLQLDGGSLSGDLAVATDLLVAGEIEAGEISAALGTFDSVTLTAEPVLDTDAATKAYADSVGGGMSILEADARYIVQTGDTMTGALVLAADPAAPLEAATKAYVDGISVGGITDGDKGDITVSGTGSSWQINGSAVTASEIANATITNAKLANVTAPIIKGRATAGAGAPEDLTPALARTVLATDVGSDPTTKFFRGDGTWAMPPSGGGTTAHVTYVYNSSTTEASFTGDQLRLNNANQTLATRLWVSQTTTDGLDVAVGLAKIIAGHQIYVQDRNDATKWVKYNVTAATDDGAYYDFTVTYHSGPGGMPTGQVEFQGIAPGTIGVPPGGTTGQSLTKTSAADYAVGWSTVSGGTAALEPYNLIDRYSTPAAFTRPNTDDYPTITVANGQEVGSTTITSGVAYRPYRTGGGSVGVNLDPVNDPNFRYGGMSSTNPATPVTSFNDFVALPFKPGGASQFAYFIWHISFETDAAEMDFSLMDRSGSAYVIGVNVNGRMRSEIAHKPGVTAGFRFGYKLTFPTAKWRRIELSFAGNTGWGGVWLPPTASIRRPLAPAIHKAVIIGDSIVNGAGADAPVGYQLVVESVGPRLMQRLGADDIMLMGIGATGWTSASTASFGGDRLTMALATNPQTIIFVGSVNDSGAVGSVGAAVAAAMTACAAVPNVWVGGSHFTTHVSLNAAIKTAVEAAGRTYVDLGAFAPTDPIYMQSDNVHPTFAGQKVLTDLMWAGMSGLNHKVNNSGGVTAIRALTQAAYDALSPAHPTTFYVII